MANLDVDPYTNAFRRVFISFVACLLGFLRGYKSIIFLDDTHIKTKWKSCLLSAVATNVNDDMYTLAFACMNVVDVENDENWDWFCYKLKTCLNFEECDWSQFTIYSDRHPELLKAIPLAFPNAHHAFCLRYLIENFKS